MQLRIRARKLDLAPETRRLLDRKLRLLLGRHAPGIACAAVTLAPGATRGGSGSRCCRIHLRLRGGARLVVEDEAEDLLAALAGAVWRLEHRLGRRAYGLRAPREQAGRPPWPGGGAPDRARRPA